MTARRSASVLLQYEVDQASAKAAQDSARAIQNSIATLTQAQRDLEKQALITSGAVSSPSGAIAATNALKSLSNAMQENRRANFLDAIAADFLRIEREAGSTAAALLQVDMQLKAIGASEDEIARVANQINQLEASAQRTGGSGGWGFLGGRSFREVGFLMRSIPGGGVAETLGRLSPLADVGAELLTGTSAAGAGLLALTGVMVTVGVVASELMESHQELVKSYKEGIAVQREAARSATELSDAENRDRAAALQREIAGRNAELEELNRQVEEARIATMRSNAGIGILGQLNPSFLTGQQSVQQQTNASYTALLQQRDEESKKIRDLALQYLELNQAILESTNAFAQAQAEIEQYTNVQLMGSEQRREEVSQVEAQIEALVKYASVTEMTTEQQEAAFEVYDDLYQQWLLLITASDTVGDRIERENALRETFADQVERDISIQQMDADERETRMNELENEITIWQRFQDTLSETDPRFDVATEAMQEMNSELLDLQKIASTNADVLNYVNGIQDNLNDSTDAYFDNITQAAEDAAKASQQWMEAQQENTEKMAELAADAASKRAEAERSAQLDREDMEDDFRDRREKQEQEHQDRVAKIMRDYARAAETAIGERDALALHRAREKRDDDLQDEADKNEKQRKQIDDAYEKQNDTIQKRLDEQLRKIQMAYDDAVRKQEQRFADERRIYDQAVVQYLTAQQSQYNQALAIQSSSNQVSLYMTENYYQTASSIQEVYQNAMLFRQQAFWNQTLSIIPTFGAFGSSQPFTQVPTIIQQGQIEAIAAQAATNKVASMMKKAGIPGA